MKVFLSPDSFDEKLTGHKIDFLICGVQKGGTTALDAYLRTHVDIGMAKQKEVHFFDDEKVAWSDQKDYAAYHSFFDFRSPAKIFGEATPIYMYWHDAPRRIWEYNPEIKLIVLLRNPLDRAYSHWNMERERDRDGLSFWEALQCESVRSKEALPLQHRVFSYIDRGFYSEQLRRMLRYFRRENILVLKHEYLKESPQACLDEVCDFLGVARFTVEHQDVHSRPYVSAMSPAERDYLRSTYEHEIRALERMLGWDCSDWLAAGEEAAVSANVVSSRWSKLSSLFQIRP